MNKGDIGGSRGRRWNQPGTQPRELRRPRLVGPSRYPNIRPVLRNPLAKSNMEELLKKLSRWRVTEPVDSTPVETKYVALSTKTGPFDSRGNKICGPFYEDEYDVPRLSLSSVAMPSGTRISINAPISWKVEKWYDSIFDIQKNGKSSRVQLNSTCMCPENQIGDNLKKIPVELGCQGEREYTLIGEEMHRTLGKHNVSSYKIAKVEKIVNCCLWERYRVKVRQMDAEGGVINERMLFHGTAAADAIVRTGFDVGRANPNGMFGPGIYFAQHSSKSNQYAAGYLGGVGHRKMLLCRVALGKTYRLTQSEKMTKPPPGYHSVTGVPTVDGLKYHEYIIYTDYQAYPEYLVSYDVEL